MIIQSLMDVGELEHWELAELFQFHAQKSKIEMGSFTALNISIAFGNRQTFTIHRYGDKGKWQIAKDRIESLFEREKKRMHHRPVFDVWVEHTV